MFLSHNLQPPASPKFIVTNVIAVELLTRKNITVLIFLTHCRKDYELVHEKEYLREYQYFQNNFSSMV